MLPLRCRSPGRVSIAANSGPSHRRLLEATPTCAADLLTARSAHPDPQDDPDVGLARPRVSGPPRRLGTRGRHETHLAWGTWISIGARSAQRPTTTRDMLSPRLGQATRRRPTRPSRRRTHQSPTRRPTSCRCLHHRGPCLRRFPRPSGRCHECGRSLSCRRRLAECLSLRIRTGCRCHRRRPGCRCPCRHFNTRRFRTRGDADS